MALNGLKLTMINNNIEQSHGSGTGSSACVDFDGTEGGLAWAVFSGNSVGAFGTAALSTILRINNAAQTEVSYNRFSSALASSAASAILITGSAVDTIIEKNEIGTNFPQAIIDIGVGTRGLRKLITLLNGFTTPGGGAEQLNISSSPADGRLSLNGSLNCPAGGGNGLQIGVLPVGFRYTAGIDVGAIAIVSSQYVPCRIAVGTDGSLTLLVVGAATQVFISASWGGQGFVRGNL